MRKAMRKKKHSEEITAGENQNQLFAAKYCRKMRSAESFLTQLIAQAHTGIGQAAIAIA